MVPVRIEDVARLAGVHRSTVSRAFSKPDAINPETRRRILEIAEQLGYTMNPLAQALRTKASNLVPLIVPEMTNPFFAELARATMDAAYDCGYRLVLCVSGGASDQAESYVDIMQTLYAPFCIIAPSTRRDLERIAEHARGTIVVIDRVSSDVDMPSVTVDSAAGIRLAMTHLAEEGHRSIAYVAGPSETLTALDRREAYRAIAQDMGMEPVVIEGGFEAAAGRRAATHFLALRRTLTAVVASNDMAAFGFMAAVVEAGIRVPQDLSVVGFDGVQLGVSFNPPLTTVAQPISEIGRAAVELAREHSRGGPVRHMVLQPELVVRQSTSPPSATTAAPKPCAE